MNRICAVAITITTAAIITNPLSIYKVSGDSMAPSIPNNSIVLAVKLGYLCRQEHLKPNDIVLVKQSRQVRTVLIKRIQKLNHSNCTVWVLGDNEKTSHDSRDFGWVPVHKITGKVLATLVIHQKSK